MESNTTALILGGSTGMGRATAKRLLERGISVHIVAPYFHGRGLAPAPYAFLVAVSFLTTSSAQLITASSTHLLTPDQGGPTHPTRRCRFASMGLG